MTRTRTAAAVAAGPLSGETVTSAAVEATTMLNEVRLVGRVSAEPDQRELPSGDVVIQLRVVVTRPPSERKQQVDTIDVACWTPITRRMAARLIPGDMVEVDGALRRRFFRAGATTQSRYEVEAFRLRRHK